MWACTFSRPGSAVPVATGSTAAASPSAPRRRLQVEQGGRDVWPPAALRRPARISDLSGSALMRQPASSPLSSRSTQCGCCQQQQQRQRHWARHPAARGGSGRRAEGSVGGSAAVGGWGWPQACAWPQRDMCVPAGGAAGVKGALPCRLAKPICDGPLTCLRCACRRSAKQRARTPLAGVQAPAGRAASERASWAPRALLLGSPSWLAAALLVRANYSRDTRSWARGGGW